MNECLRPDSFLLSVIVPLAPGETEEQGLLPQLTALPDGSEVIVVRSDDAPRLSPGTWPKRLRYRERRCTPGRARQMNLGAQVARGRWLWFLHADSRLHARTLPALRTFIEHTDALGYFDLRFRHDGPWLTRLNVLGANLRSRGLGLPFGDQGLVLPAAWFTRLGGYNEDAPHGEDHQLVWRAHAAGLPVNRISAPLATSARKYAGRWWRTTWQHLRLTVRQAWPQWRAQRRQLRAARHHGAPSP